MSPPLCVSLHLQRADLAWQWSASLGLQSNSEMRVGHPRLEQQTNTKTTEFRLSRRKPKVTGEESAHSEYIAIWLRVQPRSLKSIHERTFRGGKEHMI